MMEKCVLIAKSNFIALLSSLPTRFCITIFVYIPLPFDICEKYNVTSVQILGVFRLSLLSQNQLLQRSQEFCGRIGETY